MVTPCGIRPTSLTLPSLDKLTVQFTVVHGQSSLPPVAHWLANAGVLQPEHFYRPPDDKEKGKPERLGVAVANSLAEFSGRIRPDRNETASLDLIFVDDIHEANLAYDRDAYHLKNYTQKYKLKRQPERISALIVTCPNGENGPAHMLIGKRLRKLQKLRPGLGHAVLRILHESLHKSTRACDPVSGYGWASSNYWMGENDESGQLDEMVGDERANHEEEQEKLPVKERTEFDEKACKEAYEIFRRSDYDETIPKWAGSEHYKRRAIPLVKLAKMRLPRKLRPVMAAALAAVEVLKHAPHPTRIHDLDLFEYCRWEICPYLLRWHCTGNTGNQDSLGQIWDDFMNNEFNAGETNMEANAVFAFHDERSLRNALKRFTLWLRLLHAAENLMLTLKTKII
jgi:PRTRC genetic system protein F